MEKWYKLKEFSVLVDSNGIVLRATKNNDTLPASIYKSLKHNTWENVNNKVKFTTLKTSFYANKDTYIIR